MVNYPAQIDTSQSLPTVVDNKTPVQATVFNQLRSAVLAIESELGISPSGIYATVRSRLDTLETNLNNFHIIELAGDLGGSLSKPLVIGLQGRPLSNALPSVFQFLSWNGISWGPASFQSGGDVIGTYPSFTVTALQNRKVSTLAPTDANFLKWVAANNDWEPGIVTTVNGAIFPPVGTLFNGNVLQAVGPTSLGYGPINLAGGLNYVVGVLPTLNQANQSLIGDVTGTTASNTVTALQGFAVKNQAPTSGQVLTWVTVDSKWEPVTIPVQFAPGGDLTGTSTNQTVSSIQGLATSLGTTASANDLAMVTYNPIWKRPSTITYDGTNLWVASTTDTFVTKLATNYLSHTNYNLPTNLKPNVITSNSNYVFVGCSSTLSSNHNRLVVLSVSTGAVVGVGVYPGNTTATGIKLDDSGTIWTVDGVNLQGFTVATLIANGAGTPTAPSKTLAISGCKHVVFGVTTGSNHFLFVCDDGNSHVYSINPVTPAIVNTYTDGSARTINHLFFGTLSGTISLWASTNGSNHLLRINPDTMVLIADMASGGTNSSMEHITSDGTYIYASDPGDPLVELFTSSNVWNNEVTSDIPNATSMGGMVFDGTVVHACVPTTSPIGTQGINQFTSFGPSSFIVGPNILSYNSPNVIGTYNSSINTLPLRGNFGDAEFAFINLTTASNSTMPLASGGLININASSQTVISSYSALNAPNSIDLLSSSSDVAIIGDSTYCAGVTLKTIGLITLTGGRSENITSVTGTTYSVAPTDRIILYTGNSGCNLSLPVTSGSGRILTFNTGILTNNGGNELILVPHGSDKIGNGLNGADWIIGVSGYNIVIQDTGAGIWTILSRSPGNASLVAITNYQILAADDMVICDTTSNIITVTLTSNPAVGERHEVHDIGGHAGTNNITVARNGNNINGVASNSVISTNYTVRTFVFLGGTVGWHATSQIP